MDGKITEGVSNSGLVVVDVGLIGPAQFSAIASKTPIVMNTTPSRTNPGRIKPILSHIFKHYNYSKVTVPKGNYSGQN
jgi:hypothetical protein